jgi:hypothetical protein
VSAGIVDDGDYPAATSVREVRLAWEDLDLENTLLAFRVVPGGAQQTRLLVVNNDAGGTDFDGDNGRDRNGTTPVTTTVDLTALRVFIGSLVSTEGEEFPPGALEVVGIEGQEVPVGGRLRATLSVTPPEDVALGFYQGEVLVYEDNDDNGFFQPGETFDWVAVEVTVRPRTPDPDAGVDGGEMDAGSDGGDAATDADASDSGVPIPDTGHQPDPDVGGRLDLGQPDVPLWGDIGEDPSPDVASDGAADVAEDGSPDLGEDGSPDFGGADVGDMDIDTGGHGGRGQLRGGAPCLASVSGAAGGSGTGSLFVLGLVFLVFVLRRWRQLRGWVCVLAGLFCTLMPLSTGAVDLDRADGSASGYRVGLVESPTSLAAGEHSLRVEVGYADDVLIRADGERVVESVIDDRVVFRAGAMYAITDWLALDVMVPFSFHQSGVGVDGEFGPDNVGLLDLRSDVILTFWNPDRTRTGVSVDLWGTAPTGADVGLLGAGGVTAGAGLIGGVDLGPVTGLLNLGYSHDFGSSLENLVGGSDLRLGVAVQVPWRQLMLASLELTGATPVAGAFDRAETTAVEGSLGVKMHLAGGFYTSLVTATTLSGGYGVPSWRATAALGLAPRGAPGALPPSAEPPLDYDEDGVPDVSDECPEEREDMDGFQDDDGCPDLDNDGDGVEDAKDGAPFAAEDLDGFDDEDGVPDPDNDMDGVLDVDDAAPELPEDWDGVEDGDGVPE